MVLGISGLEIAWNFDFLIEQNQKLDNAKSRILWLRKIKILVKSGSENRKPIRDGYKQGNA